MYGPYISITDLLFEFSLYFLSLFDSSINLFCSLHFLAVPIVALIFTILSAMAEFSWEIFLFLSI